MKPHLNETEAEAGDAKNATEKVEKKCLSCYGAEDFEGQCCNTCDEVREAYRKRGWALGPSSNVEQCKHDENLESLK